MSSSPSPARNRRASDHAFAGLVGGACLALAIAAIVLAIAWPRDAGGVPIDLPPGALAPAWQPPCAHTPCLVGDFVIIPKALVVHDVEVGQKLIKRVQELEDEVERLRAKLRAREA